MGAEAKGNNLIKDDPKIYAALIDGFTKGFTDAEACLSVGISPGVLYAYIEQFPDFRDYKEQIKHNPILTAKTRVVSELDTDTQTAKWYLERKTQEFKPPQKDTNINFNQLNILTESQIKDRLAHKLTNMLTQGGDSPDPEDDSHVDVTDAEIVTEED